MKKIKKMLHSNRRLLGMAWHASPWFVILSILNMVVNPLRNLMIDVLLVGMIYNAVEAGNSFASLLPYFIALAIWYILNSVMECIYVAYIWPTGSAKISTYVDKVITEAAGKMPLSVYDDNRYYNDFVYSIKNGPEEIMGAVDNWAYLLAFSIGSIFSISILSGVEPVMLPFVAASILFSFLLVSKSNKLTVEEKKKVSKYQVREDFFQRAFYLPEYAAELRATPALTDLLQDQFEMTEKEKEKTVKTYSQKRFHLQNWNTANNVGLMFWGVMLAITGMIFLRGNILPGNILIATIAVANAALYFGVVVNAVPKAFASAAFEEKMQGFFHYASQYDAQKDAAEGKEEMITGIETLVFDHVTFAYPGEQTPVIHDLSFSVHKGETLALAGQNGTGKTTILKLIMGFYEPDEGKILMNGRDVKTVPPQRRQTLCATVFQDINLYALSVKENISMGRRMEEKRIAASVREVGGGFLLERGGGLDAEMTKEFDENGIVLSGGEEKRVALARALSTDRDIVLLDEMTSALDPEAETELMNTVFENTKDKILIIVSHKLSTTRRTDRILFLDTDKKIEYGSHEELIRKNGAYNKLFRYQAEKYIRDAEEQAKEEWRQ